MGQLIFFAEMCFLYIKRHSPKSWLGRWLWQKSTLSTENVTYQLPIIINSDFLRAPLGTGEISGQQLDSGVVVIAEVLLMKNPMLSWRD